MIYTEPTHHDSGRGFARGRTLWMSYLIKTPQMKIYISGDGGYDTRFAAIGKKYGPIDWAIIEDGQYDKAWQSVHNLPEEVMQAALDLQAKNVIPVHHSKFTLGKHPWNEPLERITALSERQTLPVAYTHDRATRSFERQHAVFRTVVEERELKRNNRSALILKNLFHFSGSSYSRPASDCS